MKNLFLALGFTAILSCSTRITPNAAPNHVNTPGINSGTPLLPTPATPTVRYAKAKVQLKQFRTDLPNEPESTLCTQDVRVPVYDFSGAFPGPVDDGFVFCPTTVGDMKVNPQLDVYVSYELKNGQKNKAFHAYLTFLATDYDIVCLPPYKSQDFATTDLALAGGSFEIWSDDLGTKSNTACATTSRFVATVQIDDSQASPEK
ncbi:MAG: hypothetical protein ACXWPM_00235 [Bdellovibrionota bacterium]